MPATYSATFIDVDYLRDITPIGANLDTNEVAPFILEAQDIYIQDILGGAYYDSLCYTIYSATATPAFSTADNIIVEMVSKCLAYWTVYEAIPHLTIKIRNIGVAQPQADNITSANMEQMRYIREEIKNKAEFWQKRTIDYLCVNKANYPLYSNPGNLVSPTNQSYDSDIYIENGIYGGLSQAEINFLKQYYYR